MRDPIQSLASALERVGDGVVIVVCPDLGMRDWLADEVASLMPISAQPERVRTVEEALLLPDSLVLLIPEDESAAVLELDGSRDRLTGRSWPVVLFLTRHGDGRRVLAERAFSLASWANGQTVDPEALAEINADEERAAFVAKFRVTPEEWLARWRGEDSARTSESYADAYRAMLLEKP